MTKIEYTRQQRTALEKENSAFPDELIQIDHTLPPSYRMMTHKPKEAWRSKRFLVQVYDERDGIERISVCRTSVCGDRWEENITWDELQQLKRECGRGSLDAVEVFPNDKDVVNVANMRHLFVLPMPLLFAWRNRTFNVGEESVEVL